MRRAAKYGGVLLLLTVLAGLVWLMSRPLPDHGPVTIRYAGVTNYNERNYALFAISNQTDKDLRGYTFTILQSSNTWIAPRAFASNRTYKDQREIWLAASQCPPNNIAVVAVPPPPTAVWRLVIHAPSLPLRKPGWRVKTASYLIQHRFIRLGRWLRPPPHKPGTFPDDGPYEGFLGPEMRGLKPK